MNRLLEIGFELAGHWLLKDAQLTFELLRHTSQHNILYAFVCDGEVKYVGKTTQRLFSRMAGYRSPGKNQTTNIRNHKRIKSVLDSGATVDILALPDNGLLHYGKFHINLAAGLEDSIIRELAPEWNGGESAVVTEPIGPEAEASQSFTMILQPTYLRSGFFNMGIASTNAIGADGEQIEIYCGDAEQPILGIINRRANLNGTPRIMGGTGLRDWFAQNMSVKQELSIAVLSPTAIRLSPR